jgi:serine/threonine protein kinase/formylglycine-generating enzyme required for sulfatase activity
VADFKTALEALSNGKINLDALSGQLDNLLKQNPTFAVHFLEQLDDGYASELVDDQDYATLKRQINQYRRQHAAETESGAPAGREATIFAQDDLPSQPSAPPSGGETVAAAQGETAAEMLSEKEKAKSHPSSLEFDVSMTQSDTSPSVGSATGPTGTAWEEPQQATSQQVRELGVGDVIKERFKLLDVLGVGGMGKVFKGIDLLKQEARDKNPYVAIKLLNEDFKSHPEAFISLQRESSRQQKLAHPNIATVYDFDRIGGPGTPVFITMELMEGQPLNSYIKKVVRKKGGMPYEEAFHIVKQLASALEYAHERRLVHSDFKPGNAFLCDDSTVKTLDFGIARAVKNPVTGEAEKTLFDPGKLGALTPAYASLEMLEGEEPDTRDDIYALGCVAYELLTGKHPFNKLPATTAKENGLVPAPIKGLNKKQNRALRHALAFRREDRSQTVTDFIEEFEGKATWYKNPYVIAAEFLLVLGIAMTGPVINYFHNKHIQELITELNTGGSQAVMAKLDTIKGLSKADQATVFDAAKDPVQKYFSAKVAKLIDTSTDNYNFPAAENVLQRVTKYYPDSLFLENLRKDVEFNKKQKVADLYREFITATDPQTAKKDPAAINKTKDILNTIREKIDPHHPLLTDPRPANAYRLAAQQAFENGNYKEAKTLVDSGLQNAPKDPRLTDLNEKIQKAIRVASLTDTLGKVQGRLSSLDDYRKYQSQIIELAGLSTPEQSPVLKTLSDNLKQTVRKELGHILKDGTRADADNLAGELGELLSALQLGDQLTRLKLAHLTGADRKQAIGSIVTQDENTVQQKLAAPAPENPRWEAELLSKVRELDTLKKEDPSIARNLRSTRDTIAKLYLDKADATLQANRFDAAEEYVNRGLRFAPDLAALKDAASRVAQGRREFEKQQRIADLKKQFDVQIEADRVTDARKILDQLKTDLPAGDPYIITEAPTKLAASYARLSRRRGDDKDYTTALQLANAGLELSPGDQTLQGLRNEYRVNVNINQLSKRFKTIGPLTTQEVNDIARKVDEINRGSPTRSSEFRKQAEMLLSQRIKSLARSDENKAAALAADAVTIFPQSSILADLKQQYQLQPWPDKGTAEAAVNAGKLSEANIILQKAIDGDYASHPDVLAFQKELKARMQQASRIFDNYKAAKQAAGNDYNKLVRAKSVLDKAKALWSDNQDIISAEMTIKHLIAITTPKPGLPPPLPSPQPCTPALAGYGSRFSASCYDLVAKKTKGPLMVVVPAGGKFKKDFAIGKYELTVRDWSNYCKLTGKCKPETNTEKFNDPVTGITLQQAQDYVKWLSARTGKKYRLPTPAEWKYAATVGGKLTSDSAQYQKMKGSFNCRVTLGDKILKGTGVANVKSGYFNAWGLKNFVGNVQEWAVGANGAEAMGGSYTDSISNCDLNDVRTSNGSADSTTGFRVILEDLG